MTTDPLLGLPSLLEAVLTVGTDLELRATLRHIADAAAQLTGARHVVLRVPGAGPEDVLTRGTEVPGEAHRLTTPISAGGEQLGTLRLTAGRAGGFTEEDRRLLQVLAAQAGVAVNNARLYGDARLRIATAARGEATSRPPAESPSAEGDLSGLVGTTVHSESPVLRQLREGDAVFTDDAATDPRLTVDLRVRFGPAMFLPLRAGDRLIGTLLLPRWRGAPRYTPLERHLAVQFASQAALALVLAGAARDRERLAVFEDRDRIARDLHDLVVQRLFATGLMLESTGRAGARRAEDPELLRLLEHTVDELRTTVQEVRTAIYALQQPPPLSSRAASEARGTCGTRGTRGAPEGVRDLVLREAALAGEEFGARLSTRFLGPVDSRVGERVAGRLLAALRDALTRATRHAGSGEAARIGITVDVTARLPDGRDAVRLTVDTGPDHPDHPDHPDGPSGTTVTWESPL